ncbi:hypothetical protein G7085_01560 [Tessaracoccus sp. HDW20]|uniref:hypothetical protein n=1 Tax=Tessaracoccus coleopterorum TaxID=2714950 RepID=UPI0018D45251|nr:hypothetical protein [Tessaracoccus coleopterorum]NHB83819.1 hypothetical protein [Tessaracoccus coleopterorum]
MLTVAVVLLGFGLVWLLRTPLGGVAFVVVMVASALVRPVSLGWPGPWEVVFCDVGQGDATVIRAGPGPRWWSTPGLMPWICLAACPTSASGRCRCSC